MIVELFLASFFKENFYYGWYFNLDCLHDIGCALLGVLREHLIRAEAHKVRVIIKVLIAKIYTTGTN